MNNKEDKRDKREQEVDLQIAAARCIDEITGIALPIKKCTVDSKSIFGSCLVTNFARFLFEYYGRPMIAIPEENREMIESEYPADLLYFIDGHLKSEPELVDNKADINKP